MALTAYEQVAERDIELLPEILDDMYTCHLELGTLPALIEYLHKAVSLYAGISPVLMLADIMSVITSYSIHYTKLYEW